MGNRFFTMPEYHSRVETHAILAAVTFLGIVPAAIFLMRFYYVNPRMAVRLHIWLQILTLLLVTVVFVLGFTAVGPKRSLTNPHHGIGVAIYVLIWVQVLGGCLVHRSEKRKRQRSLHIPLKAMLHHWLGRAIALLGITQIALGLTLYGSPLYLFVLYTLFVFALLVLYFFLEWQHERRKSELGGRGHYDGDDVVVSRPDEGRTHTGLGKLAAAAAAGAGLAALWGRRPQRSRSRVDVASTDDSATSYISNEKYSDVPSNKGFGHRLLQIAAVGTAVAAVKKLFDRRGPRDDESDEGPYRPPLGGNQSVTTDSMSRIEEGRPPPPGGRPMTPTGNSPGYVRPSHPLAQPPLTPGSERRNSTSSYSYDSYISGSPSRRDRRPQTFRDALAAGGTVFAVRQLFKNRRQKKEERRAEELRNQRIEEERMARMNSAHRYTGDGVTPPRRARNHRVDSQTASDVSSAMGEGSSRPGRASSLPVVGVGAAAAGALADRDRIRPVGTDPLISAPGAPMPGPAALPPDVPPVPPVHRTEMESSGSELYTTASGRPRHRHHVRDEAAAGLAGAAVGAMAAADHSRRRQSGRHTDSMESPPVSLKVKMHNDGRHVTLRRLTEEEAAAQGETSRRERRASAARRRRNSSFSSSSGGEALGAGTSSDRRWRRTEALEARQEAENQAAAPTPAPPAAGGEGRTSAPLAPTTAIPSYPTPPPGSQSVDPRTGQGYQWPPPPPIPASVSNLGPAGSITSPGTETSGATEYANNRRRRRAERAQARLAREGRTQNTVDFT